MPCGARCASRNGGIAAAMAEQWGGESVGAWQPRLLAEEAQ